MERFRLRIFNRFNHIIFFLLSRRIIGLFVRMKRPEKKIVEEKSRFVDYYFSDWIKNRPWEIALNGSLKRQNIQTHSTYSAYDKDVKECVILSRWQNYWPLWKSQSNCYCRTANKINMQTSWIARESAVRFRDLIVLLNNSWMKKKIKASIEQ